MVKNYKLDEEIEQFIIAQKKNNDKSSCRSLVKLVKERFNKDLSKSSINVVIKKNNLSSPVGRRRTKEAIVSPKEAEILEKPPVELAQIKFVKQEAEFMENAGFFFLKAADLKLKFTSRFTEALCGYFPDLSKQSHQKIIEAFIYEECLRNEESLWLLIGAEVPAGLLHKYLEQITMIPLLQLKESVKKVDISYNINEINDLWIGSLLRLNSFIVHFFPPEYQFLDFLAMNKRFYSLPGKLEKKGNLLVIQLFCPPGFFWINDVIWHEGFSFGANKINEERILISENKQIWINPQLQFL